MKRRIQDLCGFDNLSREERLSRANEILNSTELKQEICHQILGTSYKDVERAMESIIKERQLTPEQEEEKNLREIAPEKFEPVFDPEFEFKVNKKSSDNVEEFRYRAPTREEVARLLTAYTAPKEIPITTPTMSRTYDTYTLEQVQEFMREHREYLGRPKEGSKWDSTKTTELETKTASKTKRTNSTKV